MTTTATIATDSLSLAYVADVLQAIDPGLDYDAAATAASNLLARSPELDEVARDYGSGAAGDAELEEAVRAAAGEHAIDRY